MKAALRDKYGPPVVVEVRDVDRPVPADDQVLVHVHAAAVNRADLDNLYPRWAFTRLFLGLRKPRTDRLGLDVAGVVESVGASVTRFRPGDKVFGDMFLFGLGAFAEYACAPEEAFASMPAGMTFEDAATLAHSAVLALQGLRLRNGRTIKPGDKVLIDGASGNVGPFAVQIAKALGAEVTGVCSTAKVDFVHSLGADHVIDYTNVDYATTGERYDWIVDVDSQPLISVASDKWTGLLLWWKPFKTDDVAALTELIAAGKLKPMIDRRFPLSEVVEALRWVDEGNARGKVIVTLPASA